MAKWNKISSRWNVEDRRGSRVVQTVGWITATGLLLVFAAGMIGGQETALEVFDALQDSSGQQEQSLDSWEFAGADTYETFVSTVLWSNNALWKKAFNNSNVTYNEPKLVLFRDATSSACGWADVRYGPHYCPSDKTIYLDETFFEELEDKFWAKGWDVAEAYVIAHEVAHHVQNELWTMDKVTRVRRETPEYANQASVALELQADCYAGIWANSIAGLWILEKNEISEAIDAAESVWDDRIQKAATGRVNPESWTHWSSADRKKWFNIWYENNNFKMCDTFG